MQVHARLMRYIAQFDLKIGLFGGDGHADRYSRPLSGSTSNRSALSSRPKGAFKWRGCDRPLEWKRACGGLNVEHRTSNIEHRKALRDWTLLGSMFTVRCSTFSPRSRPSHRYGAFVFPPLYLGVGRSMLSVGRWALKSAVATAATVPLCESSPPHAPYRAK
jgi:hypothetical protein